MTKNITSEGDIAEGDLNGLVGYNLKRAYVIVQADFREILSDDDLSARLFSTLSIVSQNPGISQSYLARKLGIERSGIVAMIDELEARKFVTRKPVPSDRRRQALELTKLGQQAYADAFEKARQHEVDLFSNMTADEQATLVALLQKIRARGE